MKFVIKSKATQTWYVQLGASFPMTHTWTRQQKHSAKFCTPQDAAYFVYKNNITGIKIFGLRPKVTCLCPECKLIRAKL